MVAIADTFPIISPFAVTLIEKKPPINDDCVTAGVAACPSIEALQQAPGGIYMRATTIFAALMLGTAALAAEAAVPTPVSVASALAAPGRDADNVKLDESRKPAQVLQFLGLRSGMKVLDLFGANAYWAEIVAPAVGPRAM